VGQEVVLEGWKDGSRNLHEERGAVAFPLVLLPLLCVGMAPVVLGMPLNQHGCVVGQ